MCRPTQITCPASLNQEIGFGAADDGLHFAGIRAAVLFVARFAVTAASLILFPGTILLQHTGGQYPTGLGCQTPYVLVFQGNIGQHGITG